MPKAMKNSPFPQEAGRTDLPVSQPHSHSECGRKHHLAYTDGQTEG